MFALVAVGAAAASAGPGAMPRLVPDNSVTGFATSGHTLYVGGGFGRFGPPTGRFVVTSRVNGRVDSSYPRVEGEFVEAVLEDGHGGWFVGGLFNSVGGVPCQNLAHIRADKTVDAAWCPRPNGDVRGLSRSANRLYVSGVFESIGGKSRSQVAALDARTGAVLSWRLRLGESAEIYPPRVTALAVDGSTVYLGGGFAGVNGHRRIRLAAVDGISGQVRDWSPDPNGRVESIVVSAGRIYVGGLFAQIAGHFRHGVAAFDRRTGELSPWRTKVGRAVAAIAVASGRVYLVGSFGSGRESRTEMAVDTRTAKPLVWRPSLQRSYGPGGGVAIAATSAVVYLSGDFTKAGGQKRNGLAAVEARGGKATAWNPNPDGDVDAVAVSGSKVAVGGSFGSVGPATARVGFAALDTASGELTPWQPRGRCPPHEFSCPDYRVLAATDSAVYVQAVQGPDGRARRLAALDPVSAAVQPWRPGPDGVAHVIVPGGSVIYVGGDFKQIGGLRRRNLGSVDAVSGRATAWDPAPDGEVDALASSGSILYVGGDFKHIGGQARSNVAAVDMRTGQVTAWNPQADEAVHAIVASGPSVYVGGDFSHIGNAARAGLAAIDAATGRATAWNPNPRHSSEPSRTSVSATVIAGSTVIIGGEFDHVGGLPRDRLAAIDAVTGTVKPWRPQLPCCGILEALAVTDSALYVGGYFTGYLAAFPLSEVTRST